MTKQNTKTPHRVPLYRRPIFLIGVVVIIIVLVAVLVIAFTRPSAETPTDSQDASPASFDQPTKPSASTNDQDESIEPEGVLQYEGEDPNQLNELTGSVAYRGVDRDTKTLTVTASIDQFLQSDGNCALRLIRGDREVYHASLPATADVTTSVCGPFAVPIGNLDTGTYQIKITVSTDGKTGLITDEVQL